MTKNIIIHGDARNFIPRIKTPINCVITDPPFGVDYRSNSAVLPKSRAVNEKIEDDETPDQAILTFLSIMNTILPKLASEADLYIFTSWIVLDKWIPAVKSLTGLELKMMLLWNKNEPGQGDIDGNWGCGHECILYLKKGRRKLPFRRSGIINCNKIPAGQNIHPTEKPVQLIELLVKASTSPGDLVVDPYSGSGSTSVACQNLGRNSLAFEIKESYVQKSRRRLEQKGFVFSD